MHKSRVHITLYGFDDSEVIGGCQIDSDICYVWVHIFSFLYSIRTTDSSFRYVYLFSYYKAIKLLIFTGKDSLKMDIR